MSLDAIDSRPDNGLTCECGHDVDSHLDEHKLVICGRCPCREFKSAEVANLSADYGKLLAEHDAKERELAALKAENAKLKKGRAERERAWLTARDEWEARNDVAQEKYSQLAAENAKLRSRISVAEQDQGKQWVRADKAEAERLRFKLDASFWRQNYRKTREAMGKVPHLDYTTDKGLSYSVFREGSITHQTEFHDKEKCASLGGACALAALRESKEGANG